MSNKKTISIPSSLGSSNLSETFGKITFTPEVKELLSALNAEIMVCYNPGAEKPTIKVVSNTGKNVCSLDEFKALSGYRRFVNDMLKSTAKETSNQRKIEIVGFFLRKAKDGSLTVPARILEQNESKFNQFGSAIQVINENLENINQTVDSDWKDYLLDHGNRVLRVLYASQVQCMSSTVVGKNFVEDSIFEIGTPKWLYLKFLDRSFSAHVRDEAVTLLFPRNNYLKSIALTTKELSKEEFLTQNRLILQKSGGIIALSRADFSGILPKFSEELSEQVKVFMEKYQWTCTSPYSEKEILDLRKTGKQPPIFREAMASRVQGRRPENEIGRICREISNILGKIQSTWNGILNYVIPVANPRTEFWAELYPNAVNWEITPTNSIYDCIETEGNQNPLVSLRSATSKTILERIGYIVAQCLFIPYGTDDADTIKKVFLAMLNKQGFKKMEDFVDKITSYPLESMDEVKTYPITETEKTLVKSFLGIREKEKSRVKRTGQSSVRLDSSVLNELKPLKGRAMYEPVITWLMSTFKTGSRKHLQLIAAERILGEALKHQDEIFVEEIGEDELLEIEEYYEED